MAPFTNLISLMQEPSPAQGGNVAPRQPHLGGGGLRRRRRLRGPPRHRPDAEAAQHAALPHRGTPPDGNSPPSGKCSPDRKIGIMKQQAHSRSEEDFGTAETVGFKWGMTVHLI